MKNPYLTQQATQQATQELTQGQTLVTICKYESYNSEKSLPNAASNAATNAASNAGQREERITNYLLYDK